MAFLLLDCLFRLYANNTIYRATHANICDVPATTGQNAAICCGNMGVCAKHCTCSLGYIIAKGLFSAVDSA